MAAAPVSGSYSQIEVTRDALTGAQVYRVQWKSGTTLRASAVFSCGAYCTKAIEGLDPET